MDGKFKVMRACFFAALLLLSIRMPAQDAMWNNQLDSALVQANRTRTPITVIPVRPVDLRRIASPLGEADPIKFVQTLPGVSSGMEGTSAYYVRGGNSGNNMTMLDGMTIYGPSHLLGLTTSYPNDIIEQSNFFTGGFPSDVGGFTSSLLQLNTKDGDFHRSEKSFSVNNFLCEAKISKPIKEDRSSIIAAARISPIGIEYNLMRPHLNPELPIPDRIRSFAGDAFLKITWKQQSGDRISASVFGSHDRYAYDLTANSSQSLGWSNLAANVTWDRICDSGWNIQSRLSHNTFNAFQMQVLRQDAKQKLSTVSSLNEEGLYAKLWKELSDMMRVQAGADAYLTFFAPGVSKIYSGGDLSAKSGSPLLSVRSSLHGQMNYVNGAFQACAGIRGTLFCTKDYNTVLPIVNLQLSYLILPEINFKVSYDHTAQFFHSLEGIPTGWSMEMIVPSTGQNIPETSDQVWAGVEFSKDTFSISAGGFHKKMKDLVIYSDASSFFGTAWQDWLNTIESGTGTSSGLEVLSRLNCKRLSGQLSYTLSKTDRVFPSINFGNPIPFKFDRRHMLNLTGEIILSERDRCSQSVTAGISFMTGHWESVKSGSYKVYSPGSEETRESWMADYISHPNNFQLPYYFRADAGYHICVHGKNNDHDISIGLYNLTNRHNVYCLTWDIEQEEWKSLSILPIMPNFTYKITLR